MKNRANRVVGCLMVAVMGMYTTLPYAYGNDGGVAIDNGSNGKEGRISNIQHPVSNVQCPTRNIDGRDKYPIYPALAGHGISKEEKGNNGSYGTNGTNGTSDSTPASRDTRYAKIVDSCQLSVDSKNPLSTKHQALSTTNPAPAGSFSIRSNPYRYSTYYHDSESNLDYCQARYYSPELMRFVNRDTYDVSNRYAYCDGNPVGKVDPNGHMETWSRIVDWAGKTMSASRMSEPERTKEAAPGAYGFCAQHTPLLLEMFCKAVVAIDKWVFNRAFEKANPRFEYYMREEDGRILSYRKFVSDMDTKSLPKWRREWFKDCKNDWLALAEDRCFITREKDGSELLFISKLPTSSKQATENFDKGAAAIASMENPGKNTPQAYSNSFDWNSATFPQVKAYVDRLIATH